jgi:hypothetical protein
VLSLFLSTTRLEQYPIVAYFASRSAFLSLKELQLLSSFWKIGGKKGVDGGRLDSMVALMEYH